MEDLDLLNYIDMKKKILQINNPRLSNKLFFIFVAYVFTKTLIGLTFKPFLEIRQVVRRPVLLPVIFTPFLGLILFFIAGRIAAFLISLYGINRELMAVFLGGVLFSIIFWQILLIYLLASFIVAFLRKK